MKLKANRMKILPVFVGLTATCILTQSATADTLAAQTNTPQVSQATETNSVSERDYEALIAKDDEAHEQVDVWIEENNRAKAKGTAVPDADLNKRILQRLEPVKKAYEEFLQKYPDH